MTVRHLAWSGALGLAFLGGGLSAAEPARLPSGLAAVATSPNQHLADAVASRLRGSGVLKDYIVDISVVGGTVELSGIVADQPQREEVLRLVQGMPNVAQVKDRMTVAAGAVRRVRQTTDAPPVTLPPIPDKDKGGDPKAGNGMPEPGAIFRAPIPAYAALTPPNMPPHAWPTYAPYNNYSRVAYPTAYPYHAWPYIGPVYPYPKVPLGWRSVKLEWDDGHWWFSRVAHPHDWWKLRFW